MPTAPRQCAGVQKEFHYPLPQGSEAVYRRSSPSLCLKVGGQRTKDDMLPTAPMQCGRVPQELRRPLPPGTVTAGLQVPTAPQVVRQCTARAAPVAAPTQCECRSSTAQCPRVVQQYRRSSVAHCPKAVRQCIDGVPLTIAPQQCGIELKESHCPLLLGIVAVC